MSLWTLFLGNNNVGEVRGGQSDHIKIVNSDRWINNRIYIMQLETLIYIMYEGRYGILCKHIIDKRKNT